MRYGSRSLVLSFLIFFPARALDFFMLRQLVHYHCFVFMDCEEM